MLTLPSHFSSMHARTRSQLGFALSIETMHCVAPVGRRCRAAQTSAGTSTAMFRPLCVTRSVSSRAGARVTEKWDARQRIPTGLPQAITLTSALVVMSTWPLPNRFSLVAVLTGRLPSRPQCQLSFESHEPAGPCFGRGWDRRRTGLVSGAGGSRRHGCRSPFRQDRSGQEGRVDGGRSKVVKIAAVKFSTGAHPSPALRRRPAGGAVTSVGVTPP